MSELSWLFVHPSGDSERANSSAGPFQGPEHTLVQSPSPSLAWLFSENQTSDTYVPTGNFTDAVDNSNVVKKRDNRGGRRVGAGRPRISQLFPNVVDSAKNFVESNGFEAHKRRRETTGNCGVTRAQIQQSLYNNDSALKKHGVSLSTISRWMVAPDKRFKSSMLYTGDIDARVTTSTNNFRKDNKNAHYYFAQVKYVMEFAARHKMSALAVSCDNMNKVKIGVTAVSQHFQNTRYFPNSDAPNFPDHDFPNPGYLITSAGYMLLQQSDAVPAMCRDDIGREHYNFPRSGPMTVVNRVDSFQPCNIVAHISDLAPLIRQERKPIVCGVLDGGSDYNVNFATNIVYYMRLWRDLKLDALILTSFCPGFSAFNMIERGWATLSKKLAGVTLPDRLDGDDSSPFARRNRMTKQERRKKEAKVFDKAMELLCRYWSNTEHHGFPVSTRYEKCSEDVPRLFNDYERVHHLVQQAGVREIRRPENNDVREELDFTIQHVEKQIGTIVFCKCTREDCHHCSSNPVIATEAVTFLCNTGLPAPVPSEDAEGHFLTFIQAASQPRFPEPNRHMPRYQELGIGMCDKCPSYTFSSAAEKTRHKRLFHPRR
ncbi:uncharacterized protein [Ptychodera flava]|uniref:uncharacterized protein n=1 Tax=Ptychodera flava TaxID=63121 RepID=UPI00396A0103